MTKLKKRIIIVFCVLFLSVLAFTCFNANKLNVHADTVDTEIEVIEESSYNEVEPRLLATLSISLNGGDGKVWATVKNDFTLFPSTVYVIVQLFYSYSYCEDYNQMTLAAINSTGDLDMGKTIVAEASTGGEERFWLARVRYREGSGNWKDDNISARYSASGTYLGIS